MRSRTRGLASLIVYLVVLVPGAGRSAYAQVRTDGVVRIVAFDEQHRTSKGSGFVVRDADFIITAYHVVRNAKQIQIDRPASARTDDVRVVALHPTADLALLELPGSVQMRRRPYPRQTDLAMSSDEVQVVGFGTIVSVAQVYGGRHENRPSIPARKWTNWEQGSAQPLLFATEIDLMMLQIPAPFGLSGGAVLNANGEAIGVMSGALSRLPNVTTLSWAIPLEYVYGDGMQYFTTPKPASSVDWSTPGIIIERNFYRRAFGQPRGSLLGDLRCPGEVEKLERAWDRTMSAAVMLRQRLEVDRIMIDRGARSATSTSDADAVIGGFVASMRGRFDAVREDSDAFGRQAGMAVAACKREIGETAEIVSGFPPSENNLQAIDLLRRESLALNQQAADADRAATEAVARFAAAVATRMGKGLESSRSVESKIAAADALISAMQEILDFVIVGQGNEINQQILAVVENMLGWLETADRQPWDRV